MPASDVASHFDVSVRAGVSRVGGGAFPECDLKTALVVLAPRSLNVEDLRQALLSTDPPLVGRVEEGALCLDPRTITPKEHTLVLNALRQALGMAE